MIVVDTSAIVEIMLQGPSARAMAIALERADRVEMSLASYVEAGTVLALQARPGGQTAIERLDELLREAGIELAPMDAAQASTALQARLRFGKGFGHPAQLNFGDSFAYALAKVRGAPLLFVGDDFARTDLASALS